mgnify:CR=1 FL=1
MHQSFLVYRDYVYLRWALALSVSCIALYLWHEPVDTPNGGSWLGYALGVVGTALIIWLTWFGVRKRSYSSTSGSVQGWLSAHVYLGLSLIVVASLHCGFQFGWNVHTLAYVLMLVVIGSGVVGVLFYRWCPRLMTQAMRNASRRELLEEVDSVNASILALANTIGGEVHDRVLAEFDKGPLAVADASWLRRPSRTRSTSTSCLQSPSRLSQEPTTKAPAVLSRVAASRGVTPYPTAMGRPARTASCTSTSGVLAPV